MCFPAISPEFKNNLLITGTAGEFEQNAEAEKWFYSIPYKNEGDTRTSA